MKQILFPAALLACLSAAAQPGAPDLNALRGEGRAPYRTEFISYDIRKEADAGQRAGSKYYRQLPFKAVPGVAPAVFETTVEIPGLWLERDIYLRDDGRTGRYRIWINGRQAAVNTDTYSMGDFHISPWLHDGPNEILLQFDPDVPGAGMERHAPDGSPQSVEGIYLYSQPKIHIFDYYAHWYPDPDSGDAVLALDVIVANGYNMEETVVAGYDVFDPAGKLKEYTFSEVTIPGRGCDTIRFRNKIFGTEKYRYTAEKPHLYKVVLSLRHQGRNTEYIPFSFGFGATRFDGTRILRDGAPLRISAVEGDFPSKAGTLERLRKLKKQGVNTVYLTRPQQQWFYDMAEQEGFYLIDCAAVDCDPKGGDRGPAGTIANDPEYRDRFVDRQQNMYHRNKNRANMIGWQTGSDSGNGYNMYKSYQWLKGADPVRVVVYPYAEGEWNTDMELPAPQK